MKKKWICGLLVAAMMLSHWVQRGTTSNAGSNATHRAPNYLK